MQTAMLAAEFPGKDMSYQLIQAGFPLVNDTGTTPTLFSWKSTSSAFGRRKRRDRFSTRMPRGERLATGRICFINATGVTQNEDSPVNFKLLQNHPNPFNPSTVISFQLPVASEVSIAIYSMNGRLVRQVAKGRFTSGEHQVTWDGNDDSGRRVANGSYFYQLIAGEFRSTKRMLLLK